MMQHVFFIDADWDIVAAATPNLLQGKAEGWIKFEPIMTVGASAKFRLWTDKLGEFGTILIAKHSEGVTKLHWSGLGTLSSLSDEDIELKKRHYEDLINLYYFALTREGIILSKKKKHKNENRKPGRNPIEADEVKIREELVKKAIADQKKTKDSWKSISVKYAIKYSEKYNKNVIVGETFYNWIKKFRRKGGL